MTTALPILLMTRPEPESSRFVQDLRAQGCDGFDAVISPLIGISYFTELPALGDGTAVILTSRHAVAALQASSLPCNGTAYAVGTATAAAAQEAGFDVISADGNADALVDLILSYTPKGRLIHLRGVHSRGDITNRLKAAGLDAQESVAYDQPEVPLNSAALSALSGRTPVVAPLFSPRTAALLDGYQVQAPLSVAAMSESVTNALHSLHIRQTRVAVRPAAVEMRAVTAALLKEARQLVTASRDV